MQTQKVAKELGKYTDLRSCIIVGGDSLEEQFSMIASNPDIIIATPGRLLHLIVEMSLDIKTVEYVVFDEADRLFEMGFAVQLHEILSRLPQTRQSLLFSATLPKLLVDFAKAGLQDPTLVRLDVDTKISKDLEMAFFSIKQQEKDAALLYILRNVIKLSKSTPNSADAKTEQDKKKKFKKPTNMGDLHQTIVFASTKHHVEYLANLLMLVGYQVSYVYGTLDQTARHIQINNFRNGISNILIVTDVAARGIDIPILENVINYDFVDSSKVFIHRVGRAARAGRRGWAYSLVTPEELPYLMDLQLFLSRKLVCGNNEAIENGYDYSSDIVIGSIPRELIDDDSEWVRSRVAADAELTGHQQTAVNGYKLYCRTRPSAAAESYTRAKELLKSSTYNDPHPLVADDLNNASQQSRSALLSSITNFRPQETIFEIGQRGTRKTSEATLVMRSRRKAVAKVIDAHKSKQAENAQKVLDTFNGPEGNASNDEEDTHINLGGDVDDEELKSTFKMMTDEKPPKKPLSTKVANKSKKPTSYKDQEFYMSYTQADANTEKG
jgi:ATP-dependent RNA helicase DDX54/DBP10